MSATTDLDALVQAVLASAKSRDLDPGLVATLGATELGKGRSLKEAVKATKNKLHQATGAYLPDRPAYAAWLAEVTAATTPDAQRALCHRLLAQHASTRERLPFLDEFYTTVLGNLGPLRTVLDLACGFNPLATAWLPLTADATIIGCDIHQAQMDFLHAVLTHLGIGNTMLCHDLLSGAPRVQADVALLLKTIPCLEQLDKAIGPRLLASIDAPVIVVSYPARSLGGRAKGMTDSYAAEFAALVAGRPYTITRYDFPTELVFRLVRSSPQSA